MTRNIKTVFLWDKQLLQTVSLKEPAEYLTAYEGSLSSNSSLMITNVFMVSVTNMLSETWWISSLWISHIHSNRSLFLPVQACGWVSPCTPQPIDTSFGGTCSLVMRPPSLHGCTPCGTLLKSPHTSDRDRDVPSRRCSEDQKLYLMPAWLIFAVKPFLDFQWYLLSFFHPACVCSGLSYVHTHWHAGKDAGNSHVWPRRKGQVLMDRTTPQHPCHLLSIITFEHKWQHRQMWLSWHQRWQVSHFDV